MDEVFFFFPLSALVCKTNLRKLVCMCACLLFSHSSKQCSTTSICLVLVSVRSAFVPLCAFIWCSYVCLLFFFGAHLFQSCPSTAAECQPPTRTHTYKLSMAAECQQARLPFQFDYSHHKNHRTAIRMVQAFFLPVTNSLSPSSSLLLCLSHQLVK